MSDRISFDTNILIYSMDTNAGDRHMMAIDAIEQALSFDCSLTLQVLSEFYHVLTRKYQLPSKVVKTRVEEFMELFPVITPKNSSLKQAMLAVEDHRLSFWDAMLWSTINDAGITILLSEDFQHERIIKNVRIVNPFIPNNYWYLDNLK